MFKFGLPYCQFGVWVTVQATGCSAGWSVTKLLCSSHSRLPHPVSLHEAILCSSDM